MRKVLLAACAVLAMTGAAFGGDAKSYATVGNWEVFSFEKHCTAYGIYQNGTTLYFGANADAETWLMVSHEAWKIPAGTYRVPAQIDSVELEDMAFVVGSTGNFMKFDFEMKEVAYNLITKGKLLTLKIGSQTYRYTLKDTSGMLPKLFECVGQIAKAANPFHGQSSAPAAPSEPVSTPSNPFRRT
jgi:hypothetical protein